MIDVKIIKKPKGTSTDGTATTVIRQASVAEEAVRAGRADKADYADNAGRADAAGYADKAGRAEVAYGLTDDNIIKDYFLSKTDDDTAAGNVNFLQSINVGGNVVVGGDITADNITAEGDINAVDINGNDLYATNNVHVDKAVEANSANIATTLTAAEVHGTTKVNTPLVEATTKVQTPRAEATEVVTASVKTADFNADPLAGYGFGIYKDATLDNATKAVVDYLVVRRKMQVAVLEIAEYKSVNGGLVLSPANGVIESVEYTDDGTIYSIKLKERNQFVVGDLIRCQRWDYEHHPNEPIRSYWMAVQSSFGLFIEVAKPTNTGVIPQADDVLVLMGNTTTATRQGFAIITDDGMAVYDGVNSTNLSGKLKAKFGDLSGLSFNGNALSGYGLFGESVYLKGSFVLNNSKTVETYVMEGDTAAVREAEGYAKNYTDGRETTIRQDFVTADGVLRSSISKVTNAIQTSGVNLARLTNQGTTGWLQWNSSNVPVSIETYETEYVRFVRGAQSMTGYQMIYTFQYPFTKSIPNGQKLTLSFDIDYDDSNSATRLALSFTTRESGSFTTAWSTSTAIAYSNDGWQHFELTASTSRAVTSPDNAQIRFTFYGETTDLKIRNIKLEHGEIATTYTKAPEDTDDEITEVRSEISQTAEQISMSVVESVINNENESLFVDAATTADFTLASNFFFNPLSAFAIDNYLTAGYYTFVMRAKLGSAWESFSLAPETYSYVTFTLDASEKGTTQTITRSFQFAVPSNIRHQAVYVRLNLPSGTAYDATDPTMSAELSGVWLYKGDGIKGSLVRTGIDILTGKIILQADNVLVKNSGGTTTTMIDANGKLETHIIKADELDTSHLIARNSQQQIVATVNASLTDNNGTITAAKDNSGAYRIFYPGTAQAKLELLDVTRTVNNDTYTTTMRMFDTSGNILWELGTDAMTNGFTNPNIVMLDLATVTLDDTSAKSVEIFPSQKYGYSTTSMIIIGGTQGVDYYEAAYSASKTAGAEEPPLLSICTRYYRRKWEYDNNDNKWEETMLMWDVEDGTLERN